MSDEVTPEAPASTDAERGVNPPPTITADMLSPRNGGVEERVDFERGMSCFPVLTILLIAANLVMFIVEVASGALTNRETMIAAGALHRESVLHGEIWRLVSAMFLHGDFGHLLGNCFILYIVGMACEHAVGLWRTTALYFTSGICGFMLSLLVHPGPSVGASGAIFGLVGALVAFLFRHRREFFVREKRTGVVLATWAAYQIGIGFLTPFVDNAAHLGGLLAGAACVWRMRPDIRFRT